MANYGRVSALYVEVAMAAASEHGRASALYVEVAMSAASEHGRASALYAEVAMTDEALARIGCAYVQALVVPTDPPVTAPTAPALQGDAEFQNFAVQGSMIKFQPN